MPTDFSTFKQALLYPWNDGESGTTLVGGGILTLLSPLIVPALLVMGYNLRVVESVLEDDESPPVFADWGDLLVDGLKAAVVLLVYVLLPLAIGAAILAAIAGAAGFRFAPGPPTLTRAFALGGLTFVVALLLAGLALLVWYLAPAALVHLARTRSLRAAFIADDVRELAEASAYGSTWLLALGVLAANAVVLMVLNAAGIGVVLSGFLTFYAFVAMSFLYATGADAAGFGVERVDASAEAAVADEADDEPSAA
jgi:hypothetical protein